MTTTPTVPLGYRLAGVYCGVKSDPSKRDLMLLVSDVSATAAGVYTQNRVFGAPVGWDRKRTPATDVRVVVINSGNANACTGEQGDRDAAEMAKLAAEVAGVDAERALVMSTGIIGEFLPMENIAAGIQQAASKLDSDAAALTAAAEAMMTTDTRPKLAGRTLSLSGRSIHICGLAKGAAMIGPNMATMLSVVFTDAALTPDTAQEMILGAVDESFNCISVEGHMSTSDTVLLLANGAACANPLWGDELAELRREIYDLTSELAQAIIADGEGANHFVTIDVAGCATRGEAHKIAKTVAESALVKTAIAGGDPNWGRIVSAAGYSGVDFDPQGVSLAVNGVSLYKKGGPVDFEAASVSASIRENRDTHIELTFFEGDASVRFWTTDLTIEYVQLNADYHT